LGKKRKWPEINSARAEAKDRFKMSRFRFHTGVILFVRGRERMYIRFYQYLRIQTGISTYKNEVTDKLPVTSHPDYLQEAMPIFLALPPEPDLPSAETP
jgi:hypothetical protein